jgi:4-hydroxy-tetrahydrodipicolinate synthase
MCDAYFKGDITTARNLQLDLLPLVNALFCEVNPIPVKAAMHAMGYCQDILRLPLTPMEDANRERLLRCMRDAGVNF